MRLLLLLVLGICCPAVATADLIADLEAGLLHDSNLNNAELKQDIRSDTALTASLSAGQFIQLDENHSLTVTADLKSEVYHRYSGMSNLSAGGTLALRRKFGIGAAAPWLRLSASAARLEFKNDVRDGWLYRAALAGGKRLAERWDLQAGYSIERRTGDHATASGSLPGNVFDLKNQSLTFDVRYSLSEKTLLFAGYTWRDGDVVSTSAPNAKIFRGSTAITPDPVFGANARAYKLDATSHIANVGVSQALGSRSSLNVSYQRQITHGDGDNNYYKNIFAATYSHSF